MFARPPVRALVAIGLVAGCTLALQVLLTRLLAAVLYYHFGFLAISLALLGVGAGGLTVYLRGGRLSVRSLQTGLARWCSAFALALLLAPLVLVRLDYTFSGHVTADFVLTLALACVVGSVPFYAAGVTIALAVRGYAAAIGRVYAADLAGAGAGAVAMVPLLWVIGAPTLLVALGVVAAGAAVLLAPPYARERSLAAALAGLGVVLVVLASTTSLYRLGEGTGAPSDMHPVADRWTPLSRVIAYPPPPGGAFGVVTYDRVPAFVPRYRRGGPLPGWKALKLGPQSVGYALTGPGRALVIGGGGGRDILNALSSGQRRVDVIELNRAIRDVVDDQLAPWSGAPYTLPRVHTRIGDGRSTLASSGTRYDQIHIGFTDTLSANSAQAFALTENNLYTVEAFREYLDHLKPRGILNVSRLYHLVGDEALRATVLALEALRREGVRDPRRNVVVLLGRDLFGALFGTVLARREPYSPAELARVRTLARQRGLGVAFAPGGPYYREWGALARAPSVHAFCSSYRLDVCAPTDNRPFFFNMTRLSDVGAGHRPGYLYTVDPLLVLLITLGILAALCAVGLVLPLALMRATRRPPASALAYFGAIGLGYLLLEIALIQRFTLFLGFPTYALSVVLFALLVCTGAGSAVSSRVADPRRALTAALAAACVLMLGAATVLAPLLRALIELPFAARLVVTVVLLAPAGALLGMAMPLGLARLSALHPAGVPWAWAVNGLASVLASALAVAVAITWGFTVTTLLAMLCYLAALAHVRLGRWPRRVATPAAAAGREGAPAPGRAPATVGPWT